MQIWIQAARPKTLPASVVPVLLGSALAYHDDVFSPVFAFICMAFSILVQIGTNFANDYYDFIKGADTDSRVGPMRAVSSGLISAGQMRRATMYVLAAAFFVGLLLVIQGGWWLLLVGVLSIICAIAYTGGPFPLGYNGLGDVFVFCFFGLVAVMFTYYVQALSFSTESFWVACACGLLATNILVVNNCRDRVQDEQAGKRTTTVIFGRLFSCRQYFMSYLVVMLVPLLLFFSAYNSFVLLPLLLSPLAFLLSVELFRSASNHYNAVLAKTALFMVLYGVLLSTGICLST